MSQSTNEDTTVTGTTEEALARKNWLLVVLFSALTIVGVVLSTGLLNLGLVEASAPSGVAVPFYIYLYASLGALGYIFTKLMIDVESYDQTTEIGRLIELGMRIPLAWVLGAGTYLLANPLLGSAAPTSSQFTAGFAFLVGLYVNVAMKSLGDLADRLLGRGERS
ncbi:MAG: hypothetical protein V5A38_10005 [Halolamina sp.]|uniref:hypothetical protein n=1 Tax=Halolamina sp. TaxID=1940283 RepID=UPI002FC380C7